MSEPTEMELRVAKAIYAVDHHPEHWETSVLPFPSELERRIDEARAAIRAMREPTKEMCLTGNDEVARHCYEEGSESMGSWTHFEPWCAQKTWQAMIDAATWTPTVSRNHKTIDGAPPLDGPERT